MVWFGFSLWYTAYRYVRIEYRTPFSTGCIGNVQPFSTFFVNVDRIHRMTNHPYILCVCIIIVFIIIKIEKCNKIFSCESIEIMIHSLMNMLISLLVCGRVFFKMLSGSKALTTVFTGIKINLLMHIPFMLSQVWHLAVCFTTLVARLRLFLFGCTLKRQIN